MKAFLRKNVRTIARWPYVGRLVRIIVAVIRLPEFRDQYQQERSALSLSPTSQFVLPINNATSSDSFGAAQLPTLLQAISDLNHRQLAAENDSDNLRKSAPVALRKLARDVADLRNQIGHLSSRADSAEASQSKLAGIESQLAGIEPKLAGIESQLAGIEPKLAGIEPKLASCEQQLQALQHELGGVRSQSDELASSAAQASSKANNASESIAFAVQRIEFVRRELMFELRYGAGANHDNKALTVSSEVISHEKLDAARRGALRLNLGCGHITLDGYINVDRRALPGVDIVAEVDSLPLEPGDADEIFSSHLLEHFPEEQLRRELLPYYNSLLKTGGIFRAVVPDAEAMIAHYAQGDYPYEDMREVLYGSQDYDGDFHFNMFTPASLSSLLREAGFHEPKVIASGRKNGRCYEFEIVAEKQTAAAAAN